jgi:hypothetical protein
MYLIDAEGGIDYVSIGEGNYRVWREKSKSCCLQIEGAGEGF